MNKFGVIFKNVFTKNIKTIGFWIVLLSPLLFLAFVAIVVWLAQGAVDTSSDQIAVLSEEEYVIETFEQVADADEELFEIERSIQTEEEAETALAHDEIQGYLEIEVDETGTLQADYTHAASFLSGAESLGVIQSTLNNLQMQVRAAESGLSPEELAGLMEPADFEVHTVTIDDGESSDASPEEGQVLAFLATNILIVLMFFVVNYYANIIATELASEKGSRIMEVILSSASVSSHFWGKIMGVFAMILVQLFVYGVIGVIGYFAIRERDFFQEFTAQVDLGELLGSLTGFSILFFLMGVMLYVILSAFFGSLVSRTEDAAKAVTPVILLALAGFYMGIFYSTNPLFALDVLSYIPFFSPFLIPLRIAADTITTGGIFLALGILLVSLALITIITLQFYRSNILTYSDQSIWDSFKRSYSMWQSNRKAQS